MTVRRIWPAATAAAVCVLFSIPSVSRGAYVAEYFNDYGGTNISLVSNSLNGGQGWSGAWTGFTSPQFITNSTAGLYSGTGYSTTGNSTGGTHGAGSASLANELAYRQVAPMTGTIWLSVSVRLTAATQNALFWLDKTNTTVTGADRDFLAIRPVSSVATAVISYNGSDDNTSNVATKPLGTANLFLARIDMNVGGTSDNISWWLNPDLSSGLGGLGTTVGSTNGPAYVKTGVDAYGTGFDGIGISADSTANIRFDAIRISDESNAFDFVTTGVPEPTAIGAAAISLAGLTFRRRRRSVL